jgi:hypothetical protein
VQAGDWIVRSRCDDAVAKIDSVKPFVRIDALEQLFFGNIQHDIGGDFGRSA